MKDDLKVYDDSSDACSDLMGFLRSKGVGRVCLVTGRSSFEKSGASNWLPTLTSEFEITHIKTIASDVKTNDLNTLLDGCRGKAFDMFLAIGGGSVIDMAKLLSLFVSNPPAQKVSEYLNAPAVPVNPVIPIAAVPLTAGTGSECTPYAVVYDNKIKHSVDFPQLMPCRSILNSVFLKSLSQRQRVQTALDAFAQAIEAFWNVNSSAASDEFSSSAIKLMTVNFKNYVKGCDENQTLVNMHKASHLAGKAIAITRTTAPHALSYPMNSYFNIPHGIGVALTLGEFFTFNNEVTTDDCNDVRGTEHVKGKMRDLFSLLGANNSEEAKKMWLDYMGFGGVSFSLGSYGLSSKEYFAKIMCFGFNRERMRNNPRNVDAQWVEQMLYRIK